MRIIFLYNILSLIAIPVYLLIFVIRLIKKKDNMSSIMQRLGYNKSKRPEGKLIWMHAASVGEAMVAITLVNALNKKHAKINFLITTGTLSSAKILNKWLPANAYHQFTPIDSWFVVRKFLKYWQPYFGIFIESELWPCLISESAKKCDLILANARLSDKSFNNWQKRKWLFAAIVNQFKSVIVQSQADLHKYHDLGIKKAINLGNLKFANKELDVQAEKLSEFRNVLNGQKIFVASSTHAEDEEVLLNIIKRFKAKNINYYPIIILRHPERRKELTDQCNSLALTYSLHSQSKLPLLSDDLYIVDSFGELGLFYKLANVTFVGGSFSHGGHNLLEPAYFDNVILLGPDMSNFKNIANDMISSSAAIQIKNADELASKMQFFLDNKNMEQAKEFARNALNFVDNHNNRLDDYLSEIDKYFK